MKMNPSYFLNGCTGSGKSTLAKALQAKAGYQLLHLSLDGWLSLQGQAKWNRFSDKLAVWDRMLDGFHATIAAVIDAGNAVVVDHVLQEKRWLPLLSPVMATREVYFIGVTCPAHVAQQRIDARGTKDTETIAFQLARIHRHETYDLIVDTVQEAPEMLANRLLHLTRTAQPRAFVEIMKRNGAELTSPADVANHTTPEK
jgi:chloramphenicol 3-O phosphotransferase